MSKKKPDHAHRAVIIGKAIMFLRQNALGVSQAGLGELMGVNPGTVSRWERGLLLPHTGVIHKFHALACKYNQNALAAVFSEPIANWRELCAAENLFDLRLVMLLEILLLNEPFDPDEPGGSPEYCLAFQTMKEAIYAAYAALRANNGDVMLATPAHAELWEGLGKHEG
jgi:transcriptional regulator with XRE-family HTH domain